MTAEGLITEGLSAEDMAAEGMADPAAQDATPPSTTGQRSSERHAPGQHDPDGWRARMVDGLRERTRLSPAVERALRAVPRHDFAPWLPLEDAYACPGAAWPIPGAQAPATISQPLAVAAMLEGFAVQPGMRVLEIGAGTGYNAALLAELVGASGLVVSVDIEADLAGSARERLRRRPNVRVVHGDGGLGVAEFAPYDRIVATVGAWDLPPAWWTQLKPGGQLVVPLHLGGAPHSHVLVSFRRAERAGRVFLDGRCLSVLDMVLMRGDFAGSGPAETVYTGEAWTPTRTDELSVRAYPLSEPPPQEPRQLWKRKTSALLVLTREPATHRPPGAD